MRYLTLLVSLLFIQTLYSQNTDWKSNTLNALCFTDTVIGFSAGDHGTILKTPDRGKSWNVLPSGTQQKLSSIFFTDANHGFAAGDSGTIIKTSDGGNTWTTVSTYTLFPLKCIRFTDQDTGYVAGEGGTVLKTTDAGKNWATLTNANSMPLTDVFFTGSGNAFLTASWGGILKTTDGGNTWFSTPGTENYILNSVFFTDKNTGYTAADSGKILKTSDAGDSWKEVCSLSSQKRIKSIGFTDTNTGFAVGKGIILKTMDAGKTWTELPMAVSGNLNQICFVTSSTGFIAGENGEIFRTSDGGDTWKSNKDVPTLFMTTAPGTIILTKSIASTATFTISSNTSWTISGMPNWFSVNPLTGSGNKDITVTAQANPSISQRTAKLTISGTGVSDKTVTITQSGTTPFLTVSTDVLTLDTIANSGSFTISSNVNWNVTSDQSWLTASPVSGTNNATVQLSATDNLTDVMRSAKITVSATGVTSKTITVSQPVVSSPSLAVSVSTIKMASPANSTATFDISSKTSWNISCDQSWIKISSTTGSDNTTITLTATNNTSTVTRSARITVTGSNGTKRIITLTQDAAPKVLSVSANALSVTYSANSPANFDVISNMKWNITCNQSWITVNKTSGLSTTTINITADANPEANTRSATITISGDGVPSKTIKITQNAAPAVLSVSKNELVLETDQNSTDTFNISSNIVWSIYCDQNWLQISQTSGSNYASVVVTALTSTSFYRTAKVTIAGMAYKTIIVSQKAGPTGINEISGKEILLYPLPVKNVLNISYPGLNSPSRISISNLLGTEMYSSTMEKDMEIDMSTFAPGLYIVRIMNQNKCILTKKIIKN